MGATVQFDQRAGTRQSKFYEGQNERGHRVYMNVTLPRGVNSSTMEGSRATTSPRGSTVNFDQFTAGSHNLYEISEGVGPRTVAVETHTKRGMFIGEQGYSNSKGHLLPRGMGLEVTGVNHITYTRPDGTRGTTWSTLTPAPRT